MRPDPIDASLGAAWQSACLQQSYVLRVEPYGTIVVSGERDGDEVLCELLETGRVLPLTLAPRDKVLFWQPDGNANRGIVLGRIGLGHASETPASLLLEASDELTLRVGDGSITIRADGKILIKGKDLVSHAQRTNRIKGGSVAIN